MKVTQKREYQFLPYSRQHVTQEDIDAVIKVLRSDWLTQGPALPRFEQELAGVVHARNAVACATGTAALHLAMLALGIGKGDVVVTTPNTFLADANCALFVGAEVAFADIDPDTGNMSPEALAEVLARDSKKRVKAVIPVHFGGQPVDLPAISNLAAAHGAVVVDDACHGLGATYEHEGHTWHVGGSPHALISIFSFHPVKHVAMGEGGAAATNDDKLTARLRLFRNHGMVKEGFLNDDMATSPEGTVNPWYYEMQQLGYNYRVTDMQAALGIRQLGRLERSVERRNEIARFYHKLIGQRFEPALVKPLATRAGVRHAYHLFVVRIDFERFGVSRATVMNRLREANIGTQVHYIPIHLQPYYREVNGTGPGDFPDAEKYYAQALSLPMYPDLTDADCERVVEELEKALKTSRRL